MSKPLRTKLTKANLKEGFFALKGVKVAIAGDPKELLGTQIKVEEVLSAGDVVQVQGTSKGRGFAGGMKRHGFHGGPKTHGQSDRARAVGSIGAGTSPGRVWKGKRMPGHYGVETKTVTGLVVVFVDAQNQEIWLNGPIPGSYNAYVTIRKTGKNRQIELDPTASNLPQPKAEPTQEANNTAAVAAQEVSEASEVETTAESTTTEEVKE